jgi:hypothetical protein
MLHQDSFLFMVTRLNLNWHKIKDLVRDAPQVLGTSNLTVIRSSWISWVSTFNCSSLESDTLIFGTLHLPSTVVITFVPTFWDCATLISKRKGGDFEKVFLTFWIHVQQDLLKVSKEQKESYNKYCSKT